ncbi:hypothetical protein MMC14_008141 [Varicellaria rhodocarpa]|nr:hypothetical protein [Varicellaria rhodocarpa]
MAPESRIPAWKKIGLSIKNRAEVEKPLKLAEEKPGVSVPNVLQKVANLSEEQSRLSQVRGKKITYEEDKQSPRSKTVQGSKKPKKLKIKDKNTKASVSEAGGPANQLTAKSINETTASLASPDPLISRKRKSVNFTPDTKENDGDELQWLAEEDPKVNLSGPPKAKKQKKVHSSKYSSKLASTQNSESTPPVTSLSESRTHSILTYLDNFYKSKILGEIGTTWKFNKAKEKALLKHYFEVSIIPAKYDDALHDYIGGLQSSYHRAHLHKMASQIRQDDEEYLQKQRDLENGRKAEEYEKALVRHLSRKKEELIAKEEIDLRVKVEWYNRIQRRKRAEEFLATIPTQIPPTESTHHPLSEEAKDERLDAQNWAKTHVITTTNSNGKRKRKRKRRTGVPDDDSSSSSDDENSGDEGGSTTPGLTDGNTGDSTEDTSEEESSEEGSSEEDGSEEGSPEGEEGESE